MPGPFRSALRRCPSICTRMWRRLKRLPPLELPTAENNGVPVPSRSTLAAESQVLFQPSAHVRPQVGDPVTCLAPNQQHQVLAPLGEILDVGTVDLDGPQPL